MQLDASLEKGPWSLSDEGPLLEIPLPKLWLARIQVTWYARRKLSHRLRALVIRR